MYSIYTDIGRSPAREVSPLRLGAVALAPHDLGIPKALSLDPLGFSNGTLERWYSRIMLSPPQNMKPYLGHEGQHYAYSLLRVLLCFLTHYGQSPCFRFRISEGLTQASS